jgi:predicted site-specific integrase-resolvase
MKLSDWAEKQGVTDKTAWKWFQAGKSPVKAEQTPTGSIIVYPADSHELKAALYARVSSADQKNDLDRQIARLGLYASEKRIPVNLTVTEIGPGLKGHRPKLLRSLRDAEVNVILVEHHDRLMRFGCECLEAALAAQGRRLMVIDEGEIKDDLVRDLIEALTWFCARLYGRRAARDKAKKALKAIRDENG